jgi:DNA-directed RNA polymerase specialized sigma24 family protein
VVGLVVALKGQGSAYYVDETTGLYKYAECVEFVRKRTLQRVGRESRKAAKELKALLEADTPGLRAAEGSLSSANADPLNIVGNRDLYAQVNAWRLTLPSDTKAELDLLFCGASQPELATRLGITQQAVAKRQARLRQTLRAMATEAGLLMPDGTYDGGKGSE